MAPVLTVGGATYRGGDRSVIETSRYSIHEAQYATLAALTSQIIVEKHRLTHYWPITSTADADVMRPTIATHRVSPPLSDLYSNILVDATLLIANILYLGHVASFWNKRTLKWTYFLNPIWQSREGWANVWVSFTSSPYRNKPVIYLLFTGCQKIISKMEGLQTYVYVGRHLFQRRFYYRPRSDVSIISLTWINVSLCLYVCLYVIR